MAHPLPLAPGSLPNDARHEQRLVLERRALLQEMRRERDITAREVLRAEVAVLDRQLAAYRREVR